MELRHYERINLTQITKSALSCNTLEHTFMGIVIGFFRFMGGFSVLKRPFLSMYR